MISPIMLIRCYFRFILFAVVCFCINGISNATASFNSAKNKIHSGSKTKNFKVHKTGDLKTNAAIDQRMENVMPEIIVRESPQDSFSLPSPLNKEKPFTRTKRRKAIRHKANEVYSKEKIANQKIKDNDLAISYIPDRARASITRSMHQIVVEKEQGLKPKIEYKSVKYTMMPEDGGNEIQTSLSKKDPQTKEKDFASSVSKFLIKRKYLIGSLAGMAADNKAVQYILDGQTVFNDKYLTSTADPIAFKQKSNQKSVNKLEEVKLIKTSSTKKKYEKVYDTSVKKSKRKNIGNTSKKRTDRYNVDMNTLFNKSPVTKYDKMAMFDKLKYLQRVNEEKAKNTVDAAFDEMKKKPKKLTKKNKTKKMPDVFVTRRKSIRPKQEAIQSKERNTYQSIPLNIEIDTKDWKTNYRRKKDKLLKSMLDSTNNIENISKNKKSKVKNVKEVIQQEKIHSFMIKPNTTFGVGNTEITVGIPSYAAIRPPKKEGKRFQVKTTVQVKTLKPPSTLKAFRSDEIQKVVDTVTVSNPARPKISKVKVPNTKKAFPSAKVPRNLKPPPTHFPLKIEFVTAKLPSKSQTNTNRTVLTTTKATRKKFITNGLTDDPKNSRIITSSENLNVNLDHYADFTRTGITNGENNIVVGTLSGISDSANAGMLNLKVDTVKRENVTKITKSKGRLRTGQTSTKLNVKKSLANVKKQRKGGMTDFSISLLAAHEVERTTPAEVRTIKPTSKTPMKKSPRFVLNNRQNRGKKFVFSFKTNKKPKVKIPEVPTIPFQPAFIYKDTAEIHRSENSLYTNSIHEKPEKSQGTYFKHSIREKQSDFRWPMPSPNDTIQGIPVTQPPPEVTTLGMIISGDFVSSFAEQAFKDVRSSNNILKQLPNNILKQMPKRSKLRSSKLVKNDFLFPDQSLFTPAPKAITTMDVALAIKRRNGVYKIPGVYSNDIQKEIEALLNSTETVQLTDIPGNVDIQTSTVALPRGNDIFVRKGSEDRQFVFKSEAQAGKTKKEKLNRKNLATLESTTAINNMAASITGYDIGLSLKKDKSKKTVVQITPATKPFEETSQSPTQDVATKIDRVQSPSKEIKNVIPPTTATKKVVSDKLKFITTVPTVDTSSTVLPTEAPKPIVAITSRPTPTTPTKQTLSKLSSLNLVAERAKEAFGKINEVFKGAPDGILAVSKTDAFKKYRKAATEVIELEKSPTMVPAVGMIKPLRKSEAIYKFSQYGNQRKQAIVEDNAIKREIKKLLIQQNTIYPATLQNGMMADKRVTPIMDQNIFNKNNINANSRGILYNTPEMTSMIISTESILPEQNNAYIQNYNFPGANRQTYASSARYPSYQNTNQVTLPTPIKPQPNVYQPARDLNLRLSWTTVLPSGSMMNEFAIIKDNEMLIYVISDQIPHHSNLEKSSTLLDFTVGHMALRFDIPGTNGQICFVTHTSAKFQKTKEALQNRAVAQVVRLADPIQLYAELTTHVSQHDLHRVGGPAFYKFCKVAIKQDNVYELVMEPTGNVGGTSFTGSGLVYPSEPGLSVPITVNVESMINLKNKRF